MKQQNAVQLAIAMPAYNEEGCIEKVCQQWLAILNQFSSHKSATRLIVVNDGSKDKTGALLDLLASSEPQLIVVHQPNTGHGPALRAAYDKSVEIGAEWVFQVDSDDQFETFDFFKLWHMRHTSNFLLGFRRQRHDAWYRLMITRLVRVVNTAMFGRFIPDANIPFRLIRGEWLKRALAHIPHSTFAPNIFLSVLAACTSQKLSHIEVSHKSRMTGVVSILRWKLIKVCMKGLKELALFRLNFPSKNELLEMSQLPKESIATSDKTTKSA